ncbi:hypothetical protein B0A53_00741 [Rhodotorula sp. CCFEE 5036]|nr:hypothetical protein B0A53_00741 [Rhodotorula sp. CCFEE 5036]
MAQRLSLPSATLCLAGVALAFALAVLHSAESSTRTSSSPLYALLSLGVKFVLTSILVLLAQLALAWWIERPTLSRDRGAHRARGATFTQTRARWEAAAAATAKKEEPSSSSSSASASDAALDSVLQLVVRDFVLKWYSPLSDSPAFPNAVELLIRDALVAVSVRVARVDWSEILVGRILPLLTLHLEKCRVAEKAVHGNGKTRDNGSSGGAPLPPDSDEADLFLATRYAQETQSKKLHPAVDTASTNSRPAEDAWHRQVVESILPHILPEQEYESEAVRIMVREVVACAVMIPILETLCDPDFWNRLIDDKAGAAIQDQRMVSQFRQALDRQGAALVSSASRSFTAPAKLPSSSSSSSKRSANEIISVRTSARQFDAWLKGISRCSTLADAKRLRSDVTAQIRRAKTVTDGRQLEESVEGVTVAQWIDYIERLYVAKRRIDKQIIKLGGENSGLTRAPSVYHIAQSGSGGLSFRDILLEPNAVIYAMEYLERRRHAARAQFWLLVEGLKDPLEDLVDGDGEEQQLVVVAEEEIRRAYLDDIRMVWDVYLAQDLFRSRPALLETVRSFALRPTDQVTTPTELRTLRHALFAIQQGVLALLDEEDMPGFVKSDLYFKAASTVAAAAAAAAAEQAQAPPLPPTPAEVALTPPPPSSQPLPIVTPPTPAGFRTLSTTSEEPESPTSPGGGIPDRSRSPTPLLATLMTRTRSNSPSRPPSPSPKPILPPPPTTAQDLVATRTNTAPPQVSFHTVFDHPHSRSQLKSRLDMSDASTLPPRDGVPRTPAAAAAAASDVSPASRKPTPPLNNSLEFLISPVEDPVDRSPLFVGDLSESVDDRLEADGREAEEEDDDFVQIQTIDAIQDALSSILATSDAKATPQRLDSSISSLTSLRDDAPLSKQVANTDMRRRSASSLASTEAAISTPSIPPSPGKGKPPPLPARRNRPVFDDPETYEDVDPPDWQPSESVTVSPQPPRASIPLSRSEILEETARLAEQLDKLRNQENLVEALVRKAELTGNAVELKILVKSRESLAREVRATMYQRDQLAAQAAEDEISSKRTRITIPGTSIGQVQNLGTQTFQLYLVEVRQLGDAGATKAAWIVTKRYSEFAALHDRLRDRYTPARSLDFPSKRLVGAWSKEFIEQRRFGLERYLQSLLRFEEICAGDELRAFLSKESIALPKNEIRRTRSAIPAGPGFVRNLYRGLTSGIDDVLGTSTTSMLDAVVDRLSAQATDFAGQASAGLRAEDLVGQLSSAVATAPGTATSREEGLTSFTAPICDLFITLFDLKDKNNWLRRQAILIVLQQVLGGTIERKVRDAVTMLLSPPQLAGYLDALRGTMWPAGQLRPPGEPRTAAQKIATREAALLKLSALMPDVAANLIGRHNAKYGARRVFAALQSKRLNKHLAYSILEDLVDAIFPERTTAKERPLFPT